MTQQKIVLLTDSEDTLTGSAENRIIGLADHRINEAIPQSIEAYLQAQLERYFAAHADGLPPPGLYDRLLVRVEKPLIIQTLRATGGNQIKAAEILGINRNTLRKKMRALAIDSKPRLMSDAA